jgi:uncharacterized protein YoxC
MSWYFTLQLVLTVGLLILIGFIVFVLVQLYRTLRTFENLLTNINKDLPIILSKLQLTLDGVNYEMDRVEQVVASLQGVSATLRNTRGFVKRTVSPPFVKIAGVASGVGTAVSLLVKHDKKSGRID